MSAMSSSPTSAWTALSSSDRNSAQASAPLRGGDHVLDAGQVGTQALQELEL
jgi:hypothetical protein